VLKTMLSSKLLWTVIPLIVSYTVF